MKVLEHFKSIAAIPHCSFAAAGLRDFLADFLRQQGCAVAIDEAGNIHAHKGTPQLCLQAHYDMVCVGASCAAKGLELFEEDGWLGARESTLGADNGMGLAMAMAAAEEFGDFECLFTADEEVGLLGANNCTHKIISPRLLNLDSENENTVIIGCAASFMAQINLAAAPCERKKPRIFRAHTSGFAGGHSGIDIAKGIKSAISATAAWLHAADAELIAFSGGERSNSISTSARVVFAAAELPQAPEWLQVHELENPSAPEFAQVLPSKILRALAGFKQGVHEADLRAGFVLASANLALVNAAASEQAAALVTPAETAANSAVIMARAATNELLDALAGHTRAIFGARHTKISERDEPWEPIESDFSREVLAALQAERPNAVAKAIHAGLECGVFKSRQPALQCASIGPNIRAPHSIHERCELASVERLARVVRSICAKYQSN